jgi:hypothetical protein
MIVEVDALSAVPPAPPSDNRSENFSDTGGESHRQRAPE